MPSGPGRGWQTPTLSQAFRTGVTQLSLPSRPRPSAELTQRQIIAYLTDHVTAGVKTLAQELGLPDGEVQAGWMPFWGGTWWSGRGEATVCGRNRGTRVPPFCLFPFY